MKTDDMAENDIRLTFITPDTASELDIPMAGSSVAAGFPSPAEDHMEHPLDLNRSLIRNPASTFFARVEGDSMKDDCINDGDLLVVDKSLEPYDACVAVCFLDGEFTLKRVRLNGDRIVLMPANKKYKPIEIGKDDDFAIWGVATFAIQKL